MIENACGILTSLLGYCVGELVCHLSNVKFTRTRFVLELSSSLIVPNCGMFLLNRCRNKQQVMF